MMTISKISDDRLLKISLILTCLIPLLGIVLTIVYGFDPVGIGFVLFGTMASLGVWKRSGVGRAFLSILLLFEMLLSGVFLLLGSITSFLSGSGLSIFGSLLLVCGIPIVLTVIPLKTYTAHLNRQRKKRKLQSSSIANQAI